MFMQIPEGVLLNSKLTERYLWSQRLLLSVEVLRTLSRKLKLLLFV